MSLSQTHKVNFSEDSLDLDSVWINMEQEYISETSQDANLFDIFQMMGRSASGLTSFSYEPTELSFLSFSSTSIKLNLDFWVFPSNLDLAYSLRINTGSIHSKVYEEVPRVGNIVIPLQNQIKLPYLIDQSLSTFTWETPIYNSVGQLLNSQTINIEGPYLYFNEEIFGVIRANAVAKGHRHTATLTFPKSTIGRQEIAGLVSNQLNFNSITNTKCSVICTYIDLKGDVQEEILELKIPKSVVDLLAECPNGRLRSNPRCDASESAYTSRLTIYYSTCTGEILNRVRSDVGGNSCDNE